MLGQQTVAADVADLRTQAAAERIQAGVVGTSDVDASTRWVVRPAIEVRSSGDLTVAADWALPSALNDTAGPVQAGGASLRLVAAGHVNVNGSLSAGFAPPQEGAANRLWTPTAEAGGDIRIEAGGDILLGRPADAGRLDAPELRVRSNTGRIALAAGGDIQLAHAQVAVYTTGQVQTVLGGPNVDFGGQILGFVESTGGYLSPLLAGGGSISLDAGGDVLGVLGASNLPADWAWRGSDGTHATWWSRYDRFSAGVASFGGGDLAVRAGGSVIDLAAATASSGWLPASATAAVGAATYGGGALTVMAGADLLGGNFWSSGAALVLSAGGRIGAAPDGSGTGTGTAPALAYDSTAVAASARTGLALGRVQSTGYTAPSGANSAGDLVFAGQDNGATLQLSSTTGALLLGGQGQTGLPDELATGAWGALASRLPGQALIVAPQGDVTLAGSLVQRVGETGTLQVLAGADLRLGNLAVMAGGAAAAPQVLEPSAAVERQAQGVFSRAIDGDESQRGLDATARQAVQLVAQQGDLRLSGLVESARPVRLLAGRDLAIDGAAQLVVQHQPQRLDGATPVAVSELSLLQAGRDITAAGASSAVAGLTIAGPGDLVLIAGRDIDLGASRGVQAVGNQRNSTLLPALGADLTLLAGYRNDGQDLLAASAGVYAITGTAALTRQPGAIYAALTGTSAAAFEALPLAEQLQAVEALGGAEHDTRLAAWLRSALAFGMAPAKAEAAAAQSRLRLVGNDTALAVVAQVEQAPPDQRPALALQALARDEVRGVLDLASWLRATLAQTLDAGNARSALAVLDAPLQQAAVAGLLVQAFDARPAAERDAWVGTQLATLPTTDAMVVQARALSAYLQRVTGLAPTGEQAVPALEALRALPPERQLPWLAAVLRNDLAAAGAAAAEVGAGPRFDAAYAPAYQSLHTLFPLAGRGTGDAADAGSIVTPTSQIRTAQTGAITLLAPSGGVNAGALVPGAVTKKANELGIVTVAGGGIFAAVRDNFEVNQSRVFTLAQGDILLWASDGNVDAGRGAKTVTGAPAPVLRLDEDGNLVLDTSGSFSGSGIAALDADSSVGLFAPRGEVNAGEAGISAAGNLTIGAARVVGADNIAAGGGSNVVQPSASAGATASLASLGSAATAAASNATPSGDDDERKKRRRRNLFLDFLGFGSNAD
ncbi:MAG: filamentous hemagglutinin family protein [Rubrivivax sp.]|nr:filamentous hemagglutinin family protein [Rubrivivax sp.]